MTAATWILLAIGVLGATDILVYHTLCQNLRSNPESRRELITHALRGPTYAALFVLVPGFELHGAWYALLLGLLAFDLAIGFADFALERESRRRLGGLPTGEYLLHMALAILFGAMLACILGATSEWPARASAIVPAPAAPGWLCTLFWLMAAACLASGVLDGLAVLRLGRRR